MAQGMSAIDERSATMKQPHLDLCPCCNVDLRNECLPKPECHLDLRANDVHKPSEVFQLKWTCTMCGCMWSHGEFRGGE